jgi:cytochrome c oxidase cbb3-type subunit 3
MEDIHLTITHGIRNTTDADARYSEMPKFGVDEILDATQIDQVVEHVLAISGQEHDATLAAAGATVWADAGCGACHMDDGSGDRTQGAPNLTDAIWLYGGARDQVRESVFYARFGVMPNWNTRLTEDEIRAVAFYVHGRGSGE